MQALRWTFALRIVAELCGSQASVAIKNPFSVKIDLLIKDGRMYIKNIKELKKNLRARYRRYREKMNVEQKIRLDASIRCRLLTLEEYTRADTIFIYVSKPIEVDTLAIINARACQSQESGCAVLCTRYL